jgi:porphobilinogen synthase
MSTFPAWRARRLRRTPALRRLVAETALSIDDLVAPLFVKEGIDEPQPIPSMPGQSQHTLESLRKEVAEIAALGIPGVILFGVPAGKDARGSGADADDGIVQRALRELGGEAGDDVVLIADLCLDEYTDHGHCGVLTEDGDVDNDATLDRYRSIAVAQADAGAHLVAPSGMMDGQVAAIRGALDDSGHLETPIMAYAAKFASAFYGPFRDAAECAPRFGDRAGYQMDPPNAHEAVREALADIDEGADIVMVKPALPYLDVVRAVADAVRAPVAAYSVSGEYAMLKGAAANGWLDERTAMLEALTSIKRAGADLILTYFAKDAAAAIRAR